MPSLKRTDYPKNAKVTKKTCKHCNEIFFANKSNAKYCSNLCRHNACLERKGDNKGKQPPDIISNLKALLDATNEKIRTLEQFNKYDKPT